MKHPSTTEHSHAVPPRIPKTSPHRKPHLLRRTRDDALRRTLKMGILSVVNACSHIQNASRARLAITSIPVTKYNLNLCLALHRAGYISSVTRAGVDPPALDSLDDAPADPGPLTHANIAKSRLWLGLKYWDGKPVLQNIKPLSTPKRAVTMELSGLERIVRGLPSRAFPGLTLGESLFLTTDVGVLEAREAVERHRGGLLLCRVS